MNSLLGFILILSIGWIILSIWGSIGIHFYNLERRLDQPKAYSARWSKFVDLFAACYIFWFFVFRQ